MIRHFGPWRFLIAVLLLAIMIAAGWYAVEAQLAMQEARDRAAVAESPPEAVEPAPSPPPSPQEVATEDEAITADEPVAADEGAAEEYRAEELPQAELTINAARRQYRDGQLTLIMPKLAKVLPIYAGVTDADLKKGVGLYDYAQLPGEGNRNVSVAGHRNTSRGGVITDHAPFYYVDTLGEGDYLYMVDAGHIYRYLYEDTKVIEPDDWSVIYRQGFSCLTITSCTPIGVGSHRIVVRGRLDAIFPFTADFDYVSHREDVMDDDEA